MELNRTKQILYGIIALIILAALGFGAYWYLSSSINAPAKSDKAGGTSIVPGLPDTGGGEIKEEPPTGETPPPEMPPQEQALAQLTNFSVAGTSLTPDEDRILFYKKA